eukprot:SAG11_NODE_2740_length_3022_cov_2.199795_3_plen_63_part_00
MAEGQRDLLLELFMRHDDGDGACVTASLGASLPACCHALPRTPPAPPRHSLTRLYTLEPVYT